MSNNTLSADEFLALGQETPTVSDLKSVASTSKDDETYNIETNPFTEKTTISKEEFLSLGSEDEKTHISQDEYLQIASEDFGFFGDGREEIMQDKLYEIYNPDKDEDGVQFEQFGAGNNIRVTLPNGEQEEFGLGGSQGGLWSFPGDESAKTKEDHFRLTQFIDSDFEKLKIADDKSQAIDDIILGRKRSGPEGDKTYPWQDFLDDNVVKELNLLGLSNNEGDYEFETSKWWRNAIKITTPGGTEKTINIGSLVGGSEKEKKQVLNTIKRFIQSDPKNFTQTEEFREEKANIVKDIQPFTQKYVDNPEQAIHLLNEESKEALIKQIKGNLGLKFYQDKKFKDITRDQQMDLVDQAVRLTVDNAVDKISLDFSSKEREDLKNQGFDLETIYDHIDKRTRQRFSGLNLEIFNLNLELDDPTLSMTDREKKVNEVNGKKEQKAQKEGTDYSFFIDMMTMSRAVGEQDGANVIDLSNNVKDRSDEVKQEYLTREQLRVRYEHVNLAYDEWEQRWNGKGSRFVDGEDTWHKFSLGTRDVATESAKNPGSAKLPLGNPYNPRKIFDKKNNLKTFDGYEYTVEDGVGYITAPFAWGSKNKLMISGLGSMDDEYLANMELGVELKVDREVYDKLYALNESIKSQNVQTWYESTGTNFVRGISSKEYKLKNGIPDDQFRAALLDEVVDLGIDVSAEEKEHAKASFGETTGAALSGLPKMVADFWVGNKILAATGVLRAVGGVVGNLKKGRYAVNVAGKTKNLTKSQMVKHMGKNPAPTPAPIVIGGPQTADDAIAGWLKASGYGDEAFVPASFINRGSAVMLQGLLEGVKMEIAMQSPITRTFGLGDPDELPSIGSSYATGFGFGVASSIIPWSKMFTGLVGKASVGKGLKIPGTKSRAPREVWYKPGEVLKGRGGKPIPKEVSYKGMYDYLVAAPWSFYAGAQFGSFTNQIADDMMANKTWNDWLEENYSDWGTVLKHTATELITGLALKIGHGKKYDFASKGRLENLKRASRKKLQEDIYEDVRVHRDGRMYKRTVKNDVEMLELIPYKMGKDGKVYKKTVKNGVEVLEPLGKNEQNPLFRKGKTELDAEKYESLVAETTMRLHEIEDTKQYLHPVQGPIKFMEKWKPHLEEMGETKDYRFTFDKTMGEGFNIGFVKPGGKFRNGTINKTDREITEGSFNPKHISVDYIPHELLHLGMWKKLDKKFGLGQDIRFKGKVVKGLVELAKEMDHGDGRTLYQALLDKGVLKEGERWQQDQTKEWELFSYIAEFYGKEGNQEMIEAQYGYDKLASFTDKFIKEEFSGAHTPLNTQKDLVLFFGNYARIIDKGEGIMGSFKHLEKFVSPTKTKKQQLEREINEFFEGVGETRELRTQNLSFKIKRKENQLKEHPAFIQFQEDKDVDKYINNSEIKKIQSDLKKMRENLKNIPEDVVWGKESTIEKTINDFARVGNKLMTEKEWNARGGGKEKAMLELQKDGGIFDGIVTRGISFPIEGRSRDTWLEHVKNGIPGVDKGLMGMLERFNKGKWGTPEQNESLSGYINSQYQFRRGKVFNHYKENPVAKPLDAPAGKGATIGERLLADRDLSIEAFENEDMSQEWISNKKGEFKEVVEVEGERKVKNEIPIDKKVFEEKGGWEKTILNNVPKIEKMEEMGYRDITDLASRFTEEMYGVKLTKKQREKLNDIGNEKNLKSAQEFVNGKFEAPVMERGVNEKGEQVIQRKVVDGEPVSKTIKNADRIKDMLPDGTVKFDKGVSDKLVGRSAFPRLGTLGKLYHLATPENYTRAELSKLGFETNEKPHKDGYWRARTGPGGRIYIKGKTKGQKLTGQDIKDFVGVKKDGTYTKLSENRGLAGRVRRVINEEGRHITEQVMTESMDLNANILANLKGGKSKSFWTKALSKEPLAYNRGVAREEVKTKKFGKILKDETLEWSKMPVAIRGTALKPLERAMLTHMRDVGAKDPKFTMESKVVSDMAKEIFNEFKFLERVGQLISQKRVVRKIEKGLTLPTDLDTIDRILGKEELGLTEHLFDNKNGSLSQGIAAEKRFAKEKIIKEGVGYYESHFLSGAAEGAGIGKYRNMEDMFNDVIHKVRYSLLRGANQGFAEGKGKAVEEGYPEYDGYAMLNSIYKEIAIEQGHFKIVNGEKVPDISKLKKYKKQTKAQSKEVGRKQDVWKALVKDALKEGREDFDPAVVERLFKQGEVNKEVLLDAIDFYAKEYAEGNISQKVARQWVEMHAGNMFGLIKTAASFAVLPNMTMKEMIKRFGENPADYVLEHTTPAKYLKARIYHYILTAKTAKGELIADPVMKEAMELTIRDHHTTLVPEKYDTAVNKTLQEDLPSAHLPGMDPILSRYYKHIHPIDFNLGLRMVHGYRAGTIYDFHPNLPQVKQQEIANEVGKNIRKLFPKSFRKGSVTNFNSKNLNHLKNIDKAITNGRKLDQKRKGMSTWDFDDTLATTKSGVRATIPNPSGKPKPNRKVVFLAGGAGSGKGNVVKKLGLEKDGFKIVNQDISLEWLKKNNGLPENMNDLTKEQRSALGKLQHQARGIAKRKMMKYQGNADGVVVDGTGGSIKAMEKLVNEFKSKGYDVSMVFVETSLKTALERNQARKERSLLDKIVEKNHESVQANKPGFKTMFGERFMEVKTDNLKQEDAMPKDLVDRMNDFVRSYEKIRLDAEEFATQGKDILDNGGKFDFAEFDVVTKGEKGPFFQKALERAKKFGTEDTYVLTARPPEAQVPIYEFLKSQGLEIPLENITGLGNSTGEAKALWMLEKFAEGYNDMYFADDALQNVKAVRDVLKQVDVKSKIVQAKAQKEIDLNNVKDVENLSSPDNFTRIFNSKSLRSEYEKTISKHRPDLVKEGLVSQSVDDMFEFIDGLNVSINKRKKYQRATTKWLATSNVKLPEDGYKIKDALDLAEKYKEDIFSYRNPNELIEKYAGKAKAKPTNPKTVKEFAKSTSVNKKHGITEHVVENTQEGMQSVRDVVNSHWGKNSNPWCITQAKDGKLTEDAWTNWRGYEKGPKSIVFQNGRLLAFKANGQYWDRMDNPTDAPVVNIKEGRVTKKTELVPLGGGKFQEFVMETRTVSKDKKTVTTEILHETQDGYEVGTKIVENRVNGITVKKTRYSPGLFRPNKQEIVNYDKNGKAVSNKTFNSKGEIRAINQYGQPFGEMSRGEIIRTKGDLIEHMDVNRFGRHDWHADVMLKGKRGEVGFELGRGVKLESVLKTSPDGKIRLDLEKVAEADPNARAMIEGVKRTTLVEMIKPTKPIAKEGMQAIESVKNVLEQLDMKSDVQQTRSFNSKNLNNEINKMMEYSLDIESKKVFSTAEGKARGKDIKRRRLIMPDSAADLELLIEPLYGKGKKGTENKKWFEDNFYKPWERGVNDMNTAVQTSFNDYATLRSQNEKVVRSLQESIKGTTFTNDMAARVYIYNKAGFKIPGLAKTTEATLVEHIRSNPELLSYAENVVRLTGIETGLSKPTENWLAETLATEVQNINKGSSRKKFLQEWVDIKNEIFSPENLNKMESKLGTKWRSVIEDMFDRMETGRTRSMNLGPAGAEVMNYLNGSVGTIMNLNTRSAMLQLISSVNFINHAENNPLAAAKAFANQPQYWKDFMAIMNSDMLVQRRAGLKINVTEQELASAVSKSKNKAKAAIAWILKQGYIPTKIADSFAIASGGATYYRNRIEMYKKQGLETKEAEKKAWLDFQAIAEKTQQSSRADLLSQQQTSFIGRLILPFANTPMQMNRIMMKEVLDLSKGRWEGFAGENSFTHKASKIAYYGVIQSIIFAGLQSALFAVMGFDPDSEAIDDKKARSINTVLDSFLRGMGWQTAVISGVKNAILEAIKQDKKGWNADYGEVSEKLLNISPTIGSKYSKLDAMGNTYKYNKEEIKEKGLSLDNSPLLEMAAQGTEAVFNIPIHRMMKKADNIEGALNENNEDWQRVLMILGWSKWDVGVESVEKKKEKRDKEKKGKKKKKKQIIYRR